MEGQIIDRGIHKRTNQQTWLVRVFTGRDADGRKRYINRTVHGGKKEAQKILREMLTDRDQGTLPESTRDSVNTFLDRWLETHKSAVRPRTYSNDTEMLERYIRPYIGTLRLHKLSPLDIQELYAKLIERGLSPNTVRRAHAVLNGSLNQAIRWRMLFHNPASLVKLPKIEREEMHPMNMEEAKRFLDVCVYDAYGALFEFMLVTGVRPGEAFGLKWSDVELEQKRVRIQRALTEDENGAPTLNATKTKRSKRTIYLPENVVQTLRHLRVEQMEHFLASGKPFTDDKIVFTSSTGEYLEGRNLVQRHFKPLLKRAGISTKLRLYDLRHTCATLLLRQGTNPKIVSERLGHASIAITLDTYSHVLPDMQQDATNALQEMLFGE
ncbi:MAG: tyrosine-type recombinase/integrase [Bacilli bacterium]